MEYTVHLTHGGLEMHAVQLSYMCVINCIECIFLGVALHQTRLNSLLNLLYIHRYYNKNILAHMTISGVGCIDVLEHISCDMVLKVIREMF